MAVGIISEILKSNISISKALTILVKAVWFIVSAGGLLMLIVGDYIKVLEMDSDVLYAYLMRTGIIVCTFNVCKLFFLNLIGFKIHLCDQEESEERNTGNIGSPCPACGHICNQANTAPTENVSNSQNPPAGGGQGPSGSGEQNSESDTDSDPDPETGMGAETEKLNTTSSSDSVKIPLTRAAKRRRNEQKGKQKKQKIQEKQRTKKTSKN